MEIIKDETDFAVQATKHLEYANGYYSTLEKSLTGKKFNNDLKYNMALISIEKYFIALMACYEEFPTNHIPIGLFREAEQLENKLTPEMKKTCVLVGKFESICSIEDFGYRTPSDEDLKEMVIGMKDIKELVEKRVNNLNAR